MNKTKENSKYSLCWTFIEIGGLENNTKSLDCSSIIIVLRKKTSTKQAKLFKDCNAVVTLASFASSSIFFVCQKINIMRIPKPSNPKTTLVPLHTNKNSNDGDTGNWVHYFDSFSIGFYFLTGRHSRISCHWNHNHIIVIMMKES